ncbi:MAG: saccharopine dehydrogenase C-terminal domain-containing protein [Ginsengibacter sp.]
MKSIVIFGAGKSATYLIEYLCKYCDENAVALTVCDAELEMAKSKIRESTSARAVSVDITNDEERHLLVQNADIAISMLPPHLHFLVAKDCVAFSKHLLTASYVDDNIKSLQKEIEEKKLLFLCEMGLDPGIDHMSAMKMIDRIKADGSAIHSFKSHCGGLVAPENDDNPWHYKITWNPGNIVMAGSAGAVYKNAGQVVNIHYKEVFNDCQEVSVPGLFELAWYPNRDSLSYIETYGLQQANTFIRTTLRFPSFCRGWNKIVNLGFTSKDDFDQIKNCKTYSEWFDSKVNSSSGKAFQDDNDNFFDKEFSDQIEYLGLRSDEVIPQHFNCSAAIIQQLLETRLAIHAHEKDMIVMLHEIGYSLNGKNKMIASSLVVKGEDQLHTAMAKTVGLPLGIAAKLIVEGKINLTGLHIPVLPEIYMLVLEELEHHNIKFHEEETNL